MLSPPRIQGGSFYHIYNRGVNRQDIFIEERNYSYFLKLYTRYIPPVANTYAYSLLKNHFHFLVYIKTDLDQEQDFKKIDDPELLFSPKNHSQ